MCPPPACLLVAGPAAAPDPKADTKRTNTTVSWNCNMEVNNFAERATVCAINSQLINVSLWWLGRARARARREQERCQLFQKMPAIKPAVVTLMFFAFDEYSYCHFCSLINSLPHWNIHILSHIFQMGDIYGDMLERDLRKLRLSRYTYLHWCWSWFAVKKGVVLIFDTFHTWWWLSVKLNWT